MDADQIRQVRRFNRLVTQRAGALEDDYLNRGRPLGEARLVYEIGADGAEVATLRRRLGLDSGYASRLLGSLQAQGLVAMERSGDDGRRRRAVLTAKGLEELAAYDRRSDALARTLLARLDEAQRARLAAAMAEVERLVQAASIEIRPEPPDSADAQACLRAYFQELDARFEGGFETDAHDHVSDASMAPPTGLFVVAWLEGRPVGCGGLRRLEGGIGEVKRLWTDRSVRRMGVARAILDALEAEARRAGARRLRLDTNRVLHEAQALYAKLGWRPIERFNDDPVAHHWFGKEI
jgi:DNA-binding MarR family transcriptional regulator/GNAT superfamily N-acetyltransferase